MNADLLGFEFRGFAQAFNGVEHSAPACEQPSGHSTNTACKKQKSGQRQGEVHPRQNVHRGGVGVFQGEKHGAESEDENQAEIDLTHGEQRTECATGVRKLRSDSGSESHFLRKDEVLYEMGGGTGVNLGAENSAGTREVLRIRGAVGRVILSMASTSRLTRAEIVLL